MAFEIPSFIFGAGTGIESPGELRRKRSVSDALMSQVSSRTPQNPWEGINSVTKAMLARQMGEQADTYEQEQRTAASEAFNGLFAEGADPTIQDLAGFGGNGFATDSQQSVVNALLSQRMAPAPELKPTTAIQNYNFGVENPGFAESQLASRRAGATNVTVEGDPIAKYGAIPPGWEVVNDPETGVNTMQTIQGGPAAAKILTDEQDAADRANVQIITDAEKSQTMLGATADIKEIMESAGAQPVTGTASIPFGIISSTPAGRVRSYIETLKSGVVLSAMLRLKAASATGSTGFGAMNKSELNILIADIGALDPNTTDPDIFLDTIDRIENRYKRVIADIQANVSPERIQELGLTELFDSLKPEQSVTQQISTQSQYNALPSGSEYIAPDGSTRRKP